MLAVPSQDAVLRMGGVGGRSPPAKARRERARVSALSTRATRRVTRVALKLLKREALPRATASQPSKMFL